MGIILLAEDDESIRDFVSFALEADNHDIVTADEGGEAYRQLLENPENFDLLIADIQMPVMNGLELAAKVSENLPDLPILLISGAMEELDRADKLGDVVEGVLQKPFTLEQIRLEVNEILGLEAKEEAEND